MSSFEENAALTEVKEYVHEMYTLEEDLVERVEALPLQGSHINCLDKVSIFSYCWFLVKYCFNTDVMDYSFV